MTDDRMDRAERIRNMREGTRSTDDQTDDAADAADDGSDTASTESATDESEGSGFSSLTSDEGSTSDPASAGTASETTAPASETTTGAPSPNQSTAQDTATAASQAGEAVESRTGSTTASTDAASDAQAAAQRAAESAAETMGTGGADTATESGSTVEPARDAGTDAEAGSADDGPAVPAGATGASTVPGDISGVELPDQQLLEEAMATSSVESTEGGARAAMEGDATQSEETVRVLEFSLGDEYYCLDIEYVEEIVKRDTVTRVPNTPAFVDGVVDLRGQITTILEPKEMMDIESEGEQNLIIVFDPEQFEDQGAIGWVVDEVRQVVPIPESEVNHPPVDAEYINGVVDRDEYDQFVIWVEPEDALAQATATEEE